MKSIFLILTFVLSVFSCSKSQNKALDFNMSKFNTYVNGEGAVMGYEFNINNKYYVCPDLDFSYLASSKEFKILKPSVLLQIKRQDTVRSLIFWQNVEKPYQLIKDKNSDTLIIRKGGKEFLFKKEKVIRN